MNETKVFIELRSPAQASIKSLASALRRTAKRLETAKCKGDFCTRMTLGKHRANVSVARGAK